MQKKIKDACHLWRDSVKVPWVVGGVKKVLGPPRAGYRYHSRVRCQCVETVIIILTGNMLRGTNAITRCTSGASVPLMHRVVLALCMFLPPCYACSMFVHVVLSDSSHSIHTTPKLTNPGWWVVENIKMSVGLFQSLDFASFLNLKMANNKYVRLPRLDFNKGLSFILRWHVDSITIVICIATSHFA